MSRIANARDELAIIEKNFVVGGDVAVESLLGGSTSKQDPADLADRLLSILARFVPVNTEGEFDVGIDATDKILELQRMAKGVDAPSLGKWTWGTGDSEGNVSRPLQDGASLIRAVINRETTLLSSIVEGSTGTATAAPTRNPAFSLGE